MNVSSQNKNNGVLKNNFFMIIGICGVHGVGKTTAINNLSVKKPLVKFTDTDLLYCEGTGFKQQMTRLSIMKQVLDAVPRDFNVILDRTPYDFKVYNRLVVENVDELKIVNEITNVLIQQYLALGAVFTIEATLPLQDVFIRVAHRGRPNESEEFTKQAYDLFTSLPNLFRIITVPIDQLQPYIEKLLS